MTWVDYLVLAVIGTSLILSIIHGLVRELLSLGSWIAAFVVADIYAAALAPLFSSWITSPPLRVIAAFATIFLVVLIAMTLLAIVISRLLHSGGLGLIDRLLGAVFGLVRGVAIVTIGALLAGLTTLPKHPSWRHATFNAPLEALANVAKLWLPYDLAKQIKYSKDTT